MQKFIPVLEGDLSLKNFQRLSGNYLQDKICQKKTCKTKQMQNIPETLRKFLNQLKKFYENLTVKRTSVAVPHLKF